MKKLNESTKISKHFRGTLTANRYTAQIIHSMNRLYLFPFHALEVASGAFPWKCPSMSSSPLKNITIIAFALNNMV